MTKEEIEFICNLLRKGTVTWSGRAECLNRNRYRAPTSETNSRLVWWRDCDQCGLKTRLKDKLLEVDHIEEVGGFKGDWNDFIPRMYCRQDNLQALCIPCHTRKTIFFNATVTFKRKLPTQGKAIHCPPPGEEEEEV